MKRLSRTFFIPSTLVLLALLSLSAQAKKYVGTIVISKGDVKVLTKSLAQKESSKKFVLYEGTKYAYQKARIGLRMRPGYILQTGTNGRAKVVYSNGDHVILAPGSSVAMPKPTKDKKASGTELDLFYGKIRALVSKKGPRKQMRVKTKGAVAGVRGTDFYMSYTGGVGTDLTVLRGAVELGDKKKQMKPAVIKTGYKATLTEPPVAQKNDDGSAAEPGQTKPVAMQKGGKPTEGTTTSSPRSIEIAEATKAELLTVQAASNVKLDKKEFKELDEETQKEIKTLQKKSLKVVLDDIKAEDPNLYKEIVKSKNVSEDAVNTQVVSKLFKQAPAPKKPKKANLEEIDQIGKDVYEKYFKTE
ncbi:MAG: FecR domain-containing protein [Bdellovibrionales bacterium]|nr:FecR domain-containing protein [Bdellovibrionales bacterium]